MASGLGALERTRRRRLHVTLTFSSRIPYRMRPSDVAHVNHDGRFGDLGSALTSSPSALLRAAS